MPASTFLIDTPPDFNFDECLWFLDRNLDDCMHKVFPGSVRKLLDIEGDKILIEISEKNKNLQVRVLNEKINRQKEITSFITEWFDLDRDIKPFYRLLRKDPDFRSLLKDYRGLRIVGIPDFFEVICWCVIGQQINLAFAYKIKRRLVERYGNSFEFEGLNYYLFPKPEKLAKLSVDALKEFQMTGKKAEYLIGIAKQFDAGEISKEKIATLPDEESMLKELMKIRGIGEWTANYTIMKGLRSLNGLPYGDSGVNQALFNFKNIPKKNNRVQVEKIFNAFDGWKTYLVFYLWRSLRQPIIA